MFVCAVLLKLPPPEPIDQAAVVAPPPILAPDKVIDAGEADWQISWVPPALTIGIGFIVMVLVAVTAAQGVGALVVNVKVTVPEKFASGVKVTAAGLLVCAVLLNVPLPELMDHAPVVALPPILAPVKGIASGFADWQITVGPPAFTVGKGVTLTVALAVNVCVQAVGPG